MILHVQSSSTSQHSLHTHMLKLDEMLLAIILLPSHVPLKSYRLHAVLENEFRLQIPCFLPDFCNLISQPVKFGTWFRDFTCINAACYRSSFGWFGRVTSGQHSAVIKSIDLMISWARSFPFSCTWDHRRQPGWQESAPVPNDSREVCCWYEGEISPTLS